MDRQEQHAREMSMNAHFCWALTMWGSAEASRQRSNHLAASYAFYYSAFHAAFAWINTDHTFHMESMNEIKHSKIEGWLRDKLPLTLQLDFGLLRACREATSYLGMGGPADKLQIVRGGPLRVRVGLSAKEVSFSEAIVEASAASARIIAHVLDAIEQHCRSEGWRGPKRGDPDWLDEYLQEDVLDSIVPRNDDGRVILAHAFSFLKR